MWQTRAPHCIRCSFSLVSASSLVLWESSNRVHNLGYGPGSVENLRFGKVFLLPNVGDLRDSSGNRVFCIVELSKVCVQSFSGDRAEAFAAILPQPAMWICNSLSD